MWVVLAVSHWKYRPPYIPENSLVLSSQTQHKETSTPGNEVRKQKLGFCPTVNCHYKEKPTAILEIITLVLNNCCPYQQKSWFCSLMVMLCACLYTKGLVSINRLCYSSYFLLVIPVCSIWKQPVYLKGFDLWVLFCCSVFSLHI